MDVVRVAPVRPGLAVAGVHITAHTLTDLVVAQAVQAAEAVAEQGVAEVGAVAGAEGVVANGTDIHKQDTREANIPCGIVDSQNSVSVLDIEIDIERTFFETFRKLTSLKSPPTISLIPIRNQANC